MRNEGQKHQGGGGFIPSSFRAISGYLRIVSSGASTVASTVRSAAQSIAVDRGDGDARCDQVLWAGFDKLEFERDFTRRVLLLGFQSGFQVWDVEDVHNIHDLVSRYDGPVSFLQMLPKPSSTTVAVDKFSDSRPLLVVYTDGSFVKDGNDAPRNGSMSRIHDADKSFHGPSTVRFYSLASHSYVHLLKFRSAVFSIRCSTRVVAISQAAQVHCFSAATLEREYTILTNPVVTASPGSGAIGYGPLALGERWLAYSGIPVEVSDAGPVTPQQLKPSATFPNPASNGSLVALYAKESSKHLAAGIATLGDKGYKKLSRYCSDHMLQSGVAGGKSNGTINGHHPDMGDIGVVIVKDVLTKAVVTQFQAHKSPISALCFDPSGTLLVTASVHGHNINVFRILPLHSGVPSESGVSKSYLHLYRLQRGLTNAVIQDITFSNDSRWIMISSSRGTNHLFAISPFGGTVNNLEFAAASFQSYGSSVMSDPIVQRAPQHASQRVNDNLFTTGPPVTLSVISRIRNGNSGWRGAANGAASVASGKNTCRSGAIAAAFHHCKGNDLHVNPSALMSKYNLLVFSPSGCLIQYSLRASLGLDSTTTLTSVGPLYETPGSDSKLVIEATQKWNICQRRRELDDECDIYGENGCLEFNNAFDEGTKKGYNSYQIGKRPSTSSSMSPEERNHLFISEAELQMHEQQVPIWGKSQIYFQSMAINGIKLDIENTTGEIEIEKMSTRAVEARSKNLVPVFDYMDNLNSSSPRIAAPDSKGSPEVLLQVSHVSQNGNLRASAYAAELVSGNGAQLRGTTGETFNGALKLAYPVRGSVNTNDTPKRKPELKMEAQSKFVNNRDREYLKMEAQSKFVNSQENLPEHQLEQNGEEFD